jgi:hypothetical protein
VSDEAQVGERDQVAARGGAREAGALGHFADGQAGPFLVERLDDRESLLQAGDQVPLERARRRRRAEIGAGGGVVVGAVIAHLVQLHLLEEPGGSHPVSAVVRPSTAKGR